MGLSRGLNGLTGLKGVERERRDVVRWVWWVWVWRLRVWREEEEEQEVGSAWRWKERLTLSSIQLLEEVFAICCRSCTSQLYSENKSKREKSQPRAGKRRKASKGRKEGKVSFIVLVFSFTDLSLGLL